LTKSALLARKYTHNGKAGFVALTPYRVVVDNKEYVYVT
jgi:hypothetical protein